MQGGPAPAPRDNVQGEPWPRPWLGCAVCCLPAGPPTGLGHGSLVRQIQRNAHPVPGPTWAWGTRGRQTAPSVPRALERTGYRFTDCGSEVSSSPGPSAGGHGLLLPHWATLCAGTHREATMQLEEGATDLKQVLWAVVPAAPPPCGHRAIGSGADTPACAPATPRGAFSSETLNAMPLAAPHEPNSQSRTEAGDVATPVTASG